MRFFGMIFLLALALSGPAHSEQVVWLTPAYPPAYIPERSDIDPRWYGNGFAEQLQAWFINRIPGYESEKLDASMSRILALMQSGDRLYCLATTKPTPSRAAFMVFSTELYLQPSNRIAVRNDRLALAAPYVDAEGRIDLPALLDDARLGGSLVMGRVYSEAIDQATAYVAGIDRQNSIETPPKLLLAGRADWTIAYPLEIEWAWRASGGSVDATERPYRTYPIIGEPLFTPNHMACAKNSAGERFIQRVDQTIATHPDHPWRLYMEAWLDRNERIETEAAQQAASR